MNSQLPSDTKRMTVEEYLVWEPIQLERHDYWAGEVFAISGGSDAHNTVTLNVAVGLKNHLRGSPCRVFVNDMRLGLARDDHYTYPDVFVTCDDRDRGEAASLTKRHPLVVVEVLSPSMAAYDRGLKFQHYCALESLQELVFIDPDTRVVEIYRRNNFNRWEIFPSDSIGGVRFESVNVNITADSLFEGLDN
jgi:Uma2 family endonuclease